MKILVALDSSKSAEIILDAILARPWPQQTRFRVLTVVDEFQFPKAPALTDMASQAARAMVKAAQERLETGGFQATLDVVLGNGRSVIPEYAKEWDPDLIILGSHGIGTFGRLLLGSTVIAVVRDAHCSVEVVRTGPKYTTQIPQTGMKVLLATDGSAFSQAAARFALGRPWPRETQFHILSVPEMAVTPDESTLLPEELSAQLRDESTRMANSAAQDAVKLFQSAGVHATSSTPMPVQSIAGIIVEGAEEIGAHMILVGSHGRRGLDRFLMGSVSEGVVLHAHCAVEIIRQKKSPSTH
jgi:nucleotide-binding universal stress UspA family protein